MWRMLVLARLVIQLSLGQVARESKGEDPVWNIRHLLPEVEIDPRLIHNVTVQVGTSAQLPCSFRKDYLEEVKRQHIEKQRQLRKQQQEQLQQQQQRYHDGLVDLHEIAFETPEIHEEETFDAEHQVSWFRRRDWHILTTGIFTYTTDERFEVIHPPDSGDWTLQIRYATARDSGMYECQLSTGSGVESQFTRLQVVEPRSVLQNAAALHFQMGSTIQLDCVIVESPKPPPYVYWYHNHRVINFDTMRGGVNISTTQTDGETHSSLIVYDARESDTGNYTCSAPNTKASSTSVFVTDGDKMAAIQRRKATGGGDQTVSPRFLSSISSSLLLLLLLFFFAR